MTKRCYRCGSADLKPNKNNVPVCRVCKAEQKEEQK